jgi:hypothetical protein
VTPRRDPGPFVEHRLSAAAAQHDSRDDSARPDPAPPEDTETARDQQSDASTDDPAPSVDVDDAAQDPC